MLRLGLIVNSYAGVGGPLALKGSDGETLRQQALAAGAELRASARTERALRLLRSQSDTLEVFCWSGEMGEYACRDAGLSCTVCGHPASTPSNSSDTVAAAVDLLGRDIDLLLFTGGDGTARDILDVVGPQLPVLGIPAGVKMHSGVFAVSPEAAGELLLRLLNAGLVNVQLREVRDIDEVAFRQGQVKSRFYGELLVPEDGHFLQHTKLAGIESDELVASDIAAGLVEGLNPDTLYIIGPGSTTLAITEELGLQGSLLGVDAVADGALVAVDANTEELEALVANYARAEIIVTAIGGQGHILGRGNQQLSPALLRAVGIDRLRVIAGKGKISALQGRPLLVDSNDPELDRQLSGYRRVVTGYQDEILYAVGAPNALKALNTPQAPTVIDIDTIEDIIRDHLADSGGDARRLLHGRGRSVAGWEQVSIDYFHPLLLITVFAEFEEDWLQSLADKLRQWSESYGVSAIALQSRYRGHSSNGGPLQVLWGQLPRKPVAREAGLEFGLQLEQRQNIGFFLDMAVARHWLREHAAGKRVLNLFAYSCAFSVTACAGGASHVVNLDMSAAALRLGQQNHQRNGFSNGVSYLAHKLFRSWSKLRRSGPFDIVVVDPPSRQPGSFVAEQDYRKVIAKLGSLCAPGADVLLCLNSPHLESAFLTELVAEYAPELEFRQRLPNPPQFVDENQELSLKVLWFSYGVATTKTENSASLVGS